MDAWRLSETLSSRATVRAAWPPGAALSNNAPCEALRATSCVRQQRAWVRSADYAVDSVKVPQCQSLFQILLSTKNIIFHNTFRNMPWGNSKVHQSITFPDAPVDIRGVEKLGKAFTESTVFLDFALRCERSNMVGLTVDGWTRNRVFDTNHE